MEKLKSKFKVVSGHTGKQSYVIHVFCMFMCICKCAWRPEVYTDSGHYFLKQISLNLELSVLATLAGQKAPVWPGIYR